MTHPKKNILIISAKESIWTSFLEEYFEETSCVLKVVCESREALKVLDSTVPLVVFFEEALISMALQQKLKALKDSEPAFRLIQLGKENGAKPSALADACIDSFDNFTKFQKQLFAVLPYPDKINLIIADDDQEIGEMMIDFLNDMTGPSFEIRFLNDGESALREIKREKPDLLVLDIKMPKKDGREVFKCITEEGLGLPVIIFYDAVSSQEALEIYEWGKPAILEKGSSRSTPPELHRLILKMVYFN